MGGQVIEASPATGLERADALTRHPLEARRSQVRTPRRRRTGLLLTVLASVLIFAVLELLALRHIQHVAEDEALKQAGALTADVALASLRPHLTDELLAGDADAEARIDAAGADLIERGLVDHIKIWTADGTVAWSDERELIGRRFAFDDDENEFFESMGMVANVSDLTSAENVYDAETADRLLEVYLGARTADGTPILVETYSSYDAVDERAAALRRTFVRPMTVVLALLALGQITLVCFASRRISRAEARRSMLLERMIDASDAERRRVAAEVHDGVVQDLVGVTFALAGAAQAGHAGRTELDSLAADTRQAVGTLRALLSSVYPVEVPPGGWVRGLDDIVAVLREQGTVVSFDARVCGRGLCPVEEVLVLRIAREALRNASKHARATEVAVELDADNSTLNLCVRDNGEGFDTTHRPEGHLGLRLMHDLAADVDGALSIDSSVGAGSVVSFEMERVR